MVEPEKSEEILDSKLRLNKSFKFKQKYLINFFQSHVNEFI